MDRLVVAAAIAAVAVVVAVALQRRRPDAPTQPNRWPVPVQLDRADFVRPGAPWLVVAFTSATCGTCASVVAEVALVEGPDVAVEVAEAGERADLHRRYGIEAVPAVLVADGAGTVRASFVGPVRADDVRAVVQAPPDEPGPSGFV